MQIGTLLGYIIVRCGTYIYSIILDIKFKLWYVI